MDAEGLKRLVEGVFSPFGIVTALFATGLLVCLVRRRSWLGHRLLVMGAALWLVGSFVPLAELTISRLERDYPPLVRTEGLTVETIVILSAYASDDPGFPVTSSVSEQMMCRLVEGIRLYRQRPLPVIVSGGVGRRGDRPMAAIMADFLHEMGVPLDDIRLEDRSRNTYENLREVRRLVRDRPFLLVATASDLRRAMAVARKLEMAALPAPACIWATQRFPPDLTWVTWINHVVESLAYPSERRWSYLQWAYHEYVGYIWYKIHDRI